MTVENDFLPFGTASGNDAMSQADYAASSARLFGVSTGIADPTLATKSWRQAASMVAIVAAQIVTATGQPALDNGDLATLQANFAAMILATAATAGGVQFYGTAGTYTFTVPAGVYFLKKITLTGAGGAGGSGNGTLQGGGGASGDTVFEFHLAVTPGQTITIVNGAGGVPGASGVNNGGNGGNSTFNGSGGLQAAGGQGGQCQNTPTTTVSGGVRGTGSSGPIIIRGGVGNNGQESSAVETGGTGAASFWGGGGEAAVTNNSNQNGLAPGSGGGGPLGAAPLAGGSGADGACLIEW